MYPSHLLPSQDVPSAFTPSDPSRQRRKAFTLIELLVVISIIALLIAILLPVMQNARSRAKQLLCLSHQRQVGIGFTSYAYQNKGWYGRAQYSEPRRFLVNAELWDTYLGNTGKLMTCPDAKAQFIKSVSYKTGHVSSDSIMSSYQIPGAYGSYPKPSISNYFFGWQGAGWYSTEARPAANIPNINYTDGFYDGGVGKPKLMYIPSPTVQPILVDGYDPSGVWGRGTYSFYYNSHPDSTNVAFVDGHAIMRSNTDLEQRYRAIWW